MDEMKFSSQSKTMTNPQDTGTMFGLVILPRHADAPDHAMPILQVRTGKGTRPRGTVITHYHKQQTESARISQPPRDSDGNPTHTERPQTWTERAYPAGSTVAVRWKNRRISGTVQADNGTCYLPIKFTDGGREILWNFHPHTDEPALINQEA
jgi:hypothetical protein